MHYKKPNTSKNRNDYYEQKLRFLTYCTPFQKYVKILRSKWNVPGKLIHTVKEYQDWLKNFQPNKEFIKSEVSYITNKHTSKKEVAVYPFERDLKAFANQFELHQSLTPALRSYILYGEFDYKNFGENIRKTVLNQNPFIFSRSCPNHRKKIFMEIFGDTKLKDIQKIYRTHIEPDFIWMEKTNTKKLTCKITDEGLYKRLIVEIPKNTKLKDIEIFWHAKLKIFLPQLQKNNIASGRRQRMKTFDRDERIYQLRENDGRLYKIIVEKINKEFDCVLNEEEARYRYREFKRQIEKICLKS